MNDELDSVLFNYETTYRNDYRIREFPLRSCGMEKVVPPTSDKTRPPPNALKDIHTLSDWKKECVPFDLFINLNPIVRTNPMHIQKASQKYCMLLTEPEDLEREQAQKTRPRLIMTPAVSFDDIQSKEARQLLVSDVYLSAAKRAQREVAGPTSGAKLPRVLQLPAPANPVIPPTLRPAYVCPEWRLPSAAWDGRQLRTSVDSHREFFLRKPQTA